MTMPPAEDVAVADDESHGSSIVRFTGCMGGDGCVGGCGGGDACILESSFFGLFIDERTNCTLDAVGTGTLRVFVSKSKPICMARASSWA